jgi:TonB family protein
VAKRAYDEEPWSVVDMSAAAVRDVVDLPPESLVVLTHDTELLQTLRAVATEHEISTVGAEADLAAHLLDDHAGVAVLDTAAITSPVGQLADRLKSQFPDLVLVVAGNANDQSVLTTQITRGTVYRFLHKPVSEQRVRLFVNAAWRRHGVEHAEIIEATASNLRKPAWVTPKPKKNVLYIGGAIAAAVVLILATYFVTRQGPAPAVADAAASSASSLPGAARTNDAEFEALLARADAAFRAGAYTTPAGENAVELYRLALRRKSDDPRAGIGIERVMDRLLTAAEKALLEDRPEEAARLTDIARAVEPDHVRVAFLTTQIGKERERLLLAQARKAAASGKVEEAIAVLDRASITGGNQQLVEARNQIAQQKVDDRVGDFLRRATERIRANALVEPAQNNARFYIESARAIAPNDSNVRVAQRQLNDRIVSQARSAISAGNADDADKWIQVANEAGVSRDDINTLTRDTARVRIATRAESMAKLSQSFNQKMAQNRLVEPANDSAKFFLTQLSQAEANHPSTVLARQALGTKLLEEARGAVSRQDFAAARRWMSEAREIGVDESGTASVEREIATAQTNAQRAAEIVTASALTRTRYFPPVYPEAAQEKGTVGFVDIVFTVHTDGSVADVTVAGAEPAGIFEQAALNSVRKWRYQPVVREGLPVEQRARVRIRFSMDTEK